LIIYYRIYGLFDMIRLYEATRVDEG